MGDMSPCEHGTAGYYCDICNPPDICPDTGKPCIEYCRPDPCARLPVSPIEPDSTRSHQGE
jgi:hypothetical protein